MSRYDVIVVGTGPGGAVTARECARAGRRVLMLEDGEWAEPGSIEPYSAEQMDRQYRGGGLTVALGRPPVAYTEGRCVGGGSEVNSGLYHRPPAEILAEWRRDLGVEDLTADSLRTHHETVEQRLAVAVESAEAVPNPASVVLHRGADRLGWSAVEVPRWVRRGPDGEIEKQTMTRTYLADAVDAGVEIRTGARVSRVEVEHGRAVGVRLSIGDEVVRGDEVVLAAGATQTPALLQRSGTRRNVGSLSVHPTVKVLADFDDEVNPGADLAACQVREFAPSLSFGGSAARPELIALTLAGSWPRHGRLVERWPYQSIYYAAIRSKGRGRVRALPGFADPLVTYRLTAEDLALLRSGLARLMHLLLAAGARAVIPAYDDAPLVTRPDEVGPAADRAGRGGLQVMTVHLTGTVPLGEDPARRAVDSWGRVPGVAGLRVNDASLLPSAPGVNPQGTLMALAHRNVAVMLGE